MGAWLMKSEPSVYSIDDLAHDGCTEWDGVRNYQARNMMRQDMRAGDPVLFYHSNAEPTGVAGIARVASAAHPDSSALDPEDVHYDPKATPEDPIWWCVDVAFTEKLPRVVTLEELKASPALAGMLVTRRGMRLSVMPVEEAHFREVVLMARQPAGASTHVQPGLAKPATKPRGKRTGASKKAPRRAAKPRRGR